VNPPTVEQEDARQLHRELEALKREQTTHTNRVKSLLVSMGIQLTTIDRELPQFVEQAKLWDGSSLPDHMKQRLLREFERMQLANRQIRGLEQQRAAAVREQLGKEETQAEGNPQLEKVCQLLRLVALGPASSWLFVHEVFGWREVANRRQLASLLGLVPTPYNSGNSERDQGISKTGNRRMRTMAIEIAWCWLRWQPESALSQWYQTRFGQGSKRQRRIGIVALARKLMIALWKFLRDGETPDGARLREGPYPFSYTRSLS
jgi:transposase